MLSRHNLKGKPKVLRWLLPISLLAGLLFILFVEKRHNARFSHFASYGYHIDTMRWHGDLGIPGVSSSYCFAFSNFTFSPIVFETVQLPGGILGTGILSHHRIDRWDEPTSEWLPVEDPASTTDLAFSHPNASFTTWPGQTDYPIGCIVLPAIKGVHKGDIMRVAVFTSFAKPEGSRGQKVFYSPVIEIAEERIYNTTTPTHLSTTEGAPTRQ
jgi:hypothetical protein